MDRVLSERGDRLVLVRVLSDAKLNDVMLDGFGAMPPQQLSNDDALDVTAYLRLTFAG
jgi:hypothetical protein